MNDFSTAMASSNTRTKAHNPNNDAEVPQPPTDGVSSLTFSPVAEHLVATSWDNYVRFWEVDASGRPVPKASSAHEQPVLCAAWSPDGATILSGGCNHQGKLWSLDTDQTQVVAQHDAPVVHCFFIKELNNMLVTGSWDRTIKYWDLRQPNPVHSQQLPERVFAMDVKYPLTVVGTARRRIQVFDLTKPQAVFQDQESPLTHQTRSIACFPDATGYLVGSVEGRVAVQYVEEAKKAKNFTFKCHREGHDIFTVNSISFHPVHGSFATAGSDGGFNFWDKDSKQRLKAMHKSNQTIPCGCFNKDGTIYAYAVSYDWSRGCAEYDPQTAKNYILLHKTEEVEVKRRPSRR